MVVADRRTLRRGPGPVALTFGLIDLVGLVLLGLLVPAVRSATGPVARLDAHVTNRLHGYALNHASYTETMRVISDVGLVMWWVILTPLAVWLALRRRVRWSAFVVVTALGSSLLNHIVKDLVDRARPVLVDPVATAAGKSFPSGHTQAAVTGVGILLVVFLPAARRWSKLLAVAGAVVVVTGIGFSRIALGVHFLSDVVGAVIVGVLWVTVMTLCFSLAPIPTRTGPAP